VTFNILIPQGAQVEVIQQKASSHSISLPRQGLPSKIIPAQRQASKSEPPPPWTPPDPTRYASLSLQPQRWYEVNDTFQMRDYTILPLWVNPVRYRPANGEIELLESIVLRLTWPESPAPSLDAAVISDSPSFDRLVSQIVINPPPQATLDATTKAGEGYLIITPDEFVEELAPFVTMKEEQGYIVSVKKLSETGSTSDQIQTFIKDFYNTSTPSPTYLLLVGDTNFIPGFEGDADYFDKYTDLYFGTIDNDFIPEIAVGRLPVRTIDNLKTVLSKIYSYNETGYQSWHSQISFIASCDHFYITEESHDHVIENWTLELQYPTSFPLDSTLLGGDYLYCERYAALEPDVINSINNERGIITYSGHGNPIAWVETEFLSIISSDLLLLEDNNKFSFVASFACNTNDFGSTTYSSVFGESWMLLENKGAIAFLGSADETIWDPDDDFERAFYDSIFLDPLNPPSIRTSMIEALKKIEYPPSGIGTEKYYWETYNLLGDPSQKLWLVPEFQYKATATTLTKDGLLNSTVRYPIEITNFGNIDSYTATFEGNLWPTDIDELVNLPYQSTGTLWVNVTIPLETVVNEEAFDVVSLTVNSTSDPTLTTLFTFTTTALETFFTRLPVIMK